MTKTEGGEKVKSDFYSALAGRSRPVDASARDANIRKSHDLLTNIRYTKAEHTTFLQNQYLTHTQNDAIT